MIEKRRGSGSFLCPAAASQDRRIAVIATSLSDYIFPSLLKDIQACLSAQGFSVVIHATENSIHREREILQQLLLDPPAGILVESCKTALPNPNAELYQALRQRGLPTIHLPGHLGVGAGLLKSTVILIELRWIFYARKPLEIRRFGYSGI